LIFGDDRFFRVILYLCAFVSIIFVGRPLAFFLRRKLRSHALTKTFVPM